MRESLLVMSSLTSPGEPPCGCAMAWIPVILEPFAFLPCAERTCICVIWRRPSVSKKTHWPPSVPAMAMRPSGVKATAVTSSLAEAQ